MEARTGLVSYYVLVPYVHMEALEHISTHSAHHQNPHTSIAIQTNKAISITPDDDDDGDGPKCCRSYRCRRSTVNNVLIAIFSILRMSSRMLRSTRANDLDNGSQSSRVLNRFRKTNKPLSSSMERVGESFSSQSPPFRTSTNTDRIFME